MWSTEPSMEKVRKAIRKLEAPVLRDAAAAAAAAAVAVAAAAGPGTGAPDAAAATASGAITATGGSEA